MKCKECRTEFRREDRVSPSAMAGALESVTYCSDRCKRKAGNRRYYERHKERIKPINAARKRERQRKAHKE